VNRETAYKIAIEALSEKRRRYYSFDYNINQLYPGISNETQVKNYERITEAIRILDAEKEHKQLELFA